MSLYICMYYVKACRYGCVFTVRDIYIPGSGAPHNFRRVSKGGISQNSPLLSLVPSPWECFAARLFPFPVCW